MHNPLEKILDTLFLIHPNLKRLLREKAKTASAPDLIELMAYLQKLKFAESALLGTCLKTDPDFIAKLNAIHFRHKKEALRKLEEADKTE